MVTHVGQFGMPEVLDTVLHIMVLEDVARTRIVVPMKEKVETCGRFVREVRVHCMPFVWTDPYRGTLDTVQQWMEC